MSRFPRKPSPAIVVAVIALSVAVGGTAVGGNQPEANVPGALAGIKANGTVDPDVPSRALTNARVDHPVQGFYCFNLAFAPRAAAVTGAVDDGLADDAVLSYTLDPGQFVQCPPSADAEVTNLDGSDDFSLQNDAFNIHFFR